MKLAIDPFMVRHRGLDGTCRFAAEMGYAWIELSIREDFIPIFEGPRASRQKLAELKSALASNNVGLANMWTVYRWAEPDDPEAHEAAMRFFPRFVDAAVDLGLSNISSEFSGRPEKRERSDYAFWKSMETIVPILEDARMTMALDPHPGDFVEDGVTAIDIIRAIGSDYVKFLYSTPHTFFLTDDIIKLIDYAGKDLLIVRLADTFDHRQPLRYIVNPLGAPVAVHQHLNIGEGEIDWDAVFGGLKRIAFDGTLSVSVFAWPDKPEESARKMLQATSRLVEQYGLGTAAGA